MCFNSADDIYYYINVYLSFGTTVVGASNYTVSSRHYLHGTQMANRQQTQAMSDQREQQAAQIVAPLYQALNG